MFVSGGTDECGSSLSRQYSDPSSTFAHARSAPLCAPASEVLTEGQQEELTWIRCMGELTSLQRQSQSTADVTPISVSYLSAGQ